MAKAKKVRRVRQKQAAKPKTETPKTTTSRKPSRRRAGQTAEPAKKLSATEQFQQEYAYVLRDLRLVFILAGIMFALLIALNLILR